MTNQDDDDLEPKKKKSQVSSMYGGSVEIPEATNQVGSMYSSKTKKAKKKTVAGCPSEFGITPAFSSEVSNMYGEYPKTLRPSSNVGSMYGGIPQNYRSKIPLDEKYKIGVKQPDNLSSNRDITEREGLSNTDKEKLYPAMLDYLKDKKKRFVLKKVQELVFNEYGIIVIFSDAGVKRNDKNEEEAHKLLKILLFALYKTENKEDLITKLRTVFLFMNRNELDRLIEKVRAELKEFTGEDLFKNWLKKQEIEEGEEDFYEVEKTKEFKDEKKEIEIKEPTVLISNDKSRDKEMTDNLEAIKEENYIKYYFKTYPNLLSYNEILKIASFYEKELERLCNEYASKLRKIMNKILPEKIFEQEITLDFWYNILGFHWDNEIRRVINYKESYAVSVEKLKIIQSKIFDIFYEKIELPEKDNEFEITCYNCGQPLKYQLKDVNNLPIRARKKCPHCGKMITLKILEENGEFDVKPLTEFNGEKKESVYLKLEILTEIDNFFQDYIKFSDYTTGIAGHRVKFSEITFKPNSTDLEARSWLIENIRYVFPRYCELPLSNNLFNWFLFGDPNIEFQYKLTQDFLSPERVSYRPQISILLKIDYRISRLTISDFKRFNIEITKNNLVELRNFVSYIIFNFLFKNPYEIPYISDTTTGEIPVGENYFIPDYFIIRAIFFIMCDIFNVNSISFEEIRRKLRIKTNFEKYLQKGYTISNLLITIKKEIKKILNLNSNVLDREIVNSFYGELDLYDRINEIRYNNYRSILDFASNFQRKVHNFIEQYFGVKFDTEKQIIKLVKSNKIEINGVRKFIHYNLKFDGYYELIDLIREKFGLNKKWKGIIFEAHGMWHTELDLYLRMFPYKNEDHFYRRQELDQFKRDICKKFNYLLIEIYQNIDESQWDIEIRRQIERQVKNEIL